MDHDYVVYVDESGDHTLEVFNPVYPIFVLVFCLFSVEDYLTKMVPAIQALKFKHFGHDAIVLHERGISKAKDGFHFLVDEVRKEAFMRDLSHIVEYSPFSIVAVTVDKTKCTKGGQNPYALALSEGMILVRRFLKSQGCCEGRVPLVLESRGSADDQTLLRAVKPLCQEEAGVHLDVLFAEKKVNCCGLQIADLVARPIGRAMLNPLQLNRAFQKIMGKLYQSRIILPQVKASSGLFMELRGSVG